MGGVCCNKEQESVHDMQMQRSVSWKSATTDIDGNPIIKDDPKKAPPPKILKQKDSFDNFTKKEEKRRRSLDRFRGGKGDRSAAEAETAETETRKKMHEAAEKKIQIELDKKAAVAEQDDPPPAYLEQHYSRYVDKRDQAEEIKRDKADRKRDKAEKKREDKTE